MSPVAGGVPAAVNIRGEDGVETVVTRDEDASGVAGDVLAAYDEFLLCFAPRRLANAP